MDIHILTSFFMWCMILNGGLLVVWALFVKVAPDLLYRTQKAWFPGSPETLGVMLYGYLGVFKIFFLVFNVVPYVALRIIA